MYCVIIAGGTGGMLSAVRQLSQLFTRRSEIDCRAARGRGTYYTISCLSLPISFALLLVSIFVATAAVVALVKMYGSSRRVSFLNTRYISIYISKMAALTVHIQRAHCIFKLPIW